VSLGHYAGADTKGLFQGILNELNAASDAPLQNVDEWPLLLEAIATRVANLAGELGLRAVLVEEIPLSAAPAMEEFLYRVSLLLVMLSQRDSTRGVLFAFSSVSNPTEGLQKNPKMQELIKLIYLGEWKVADAELLVRKISSELNVRIATTDAEKLVGDTRRSPRSIKMFFLNYLTISLDRVAVFDEIMAVTFAGDRV
jgi:hypothetical protein